MHTIPDGVPPTRNDPAQKSDRDSPRKDADDVKEDRLDEEMRDE